MNESNQQASLFTAIADVQRRKILAILKEQELSVADIKSHFDFSGATLSHHLSILKKAELVRVRRQGQQRIYTLNLSVAEELLLIMKQLFNRENDEIE
ncbi:metalloregulator ArsR/SmtB family transcription factor [Marinicella sp. S1101]|uniref:metalloregulator ArsR/SmtB family transcription factor n=1 Tax=Marinicella marina TaxID=2996016 RepID=UPI002260B99B|nr:metalloregulator ArsR/SmtB family transcription factor [Marinicella marina]MCX7554912.1 metalloregulator ArsR/SmtB family transcription factor [Marinicella marina]MDJ1141264.1 metalloregulator ArsR/SmtB family transcription factor [Marinicella marina]